MPVVFCSLIMPVYQKNKGVLTQSRIQKMLDGPSKKTENTKKHTKSKKKNLATTNSNKITMLQGPKKTVGSLLLQDLHQGRDGLRIAQQMTAQDRAGLGVDTSQ